MKILIKAIKPHRQKILTSDGEEMHIQRWANKQAAQTIRGAGGDAAGEQFTQARDKLMRDAVANPEEHGLKFLNERVPFEGQNLESSLSEPNVEGEQEDIHNEALADWEARQSDIDFSREQGHTDGFEGKPYHDTEQEELDADKKRFYENFPNLKPETPDLFDSEGKLRDGMPPEEEEFKPDAEAEHMRRIMTSRQVPMRDAWSILKNNGYVACPRCGFEDDSEDHKMKIRTAGKCDSCLQDDFKNEYYRDGTY